ncbi:hypothetical protein [Pseudomonas cannabina]|uniref:Uncharacterized protein n=1 Tax=Pseudomonas cannabina pv. alisalensis TaxID=757414 RepID=A0ABS1XLU3_PSEC1|nr:hypothetical protein [Pseudomonas cannabina]MBM0142467.1 hypothetical protein [Pseudomonas cannabina pv. alisalensis]
MGVIPDNKLRLTSKCAWIASNGYNKFCASFLYVYVRQWFNPADNNYAFAQPRFQVKNAQFFAQL